VQLTDPTLAQVVATGVVAPSKEGRSTVQVRVGDQVQKVPIEIRGIAKDEPVHFAGEVVPILTKAGCNQGACHGGQHGKGGFRLSLLGFEPEPDYTAIVKSAEGRRVTPFFPEESLLLLKPTRAVAHGAGLRLKPDSAEYALIRLW